MGFDEAWLKEYGQVEPLLGDGRFKEGFERGYTAALQAKESGGSAASNSGITVSPKSPADGEDCDTCVHDWTDCVVHMLKCKGYVRQATS